MSYTIGFQAKTRRQFWRKIRGGNGKARPSQMGNLQHCGEAQDEIKFIRSPQEGGDMGIEMLLLLAKEEAEEMPRHA